MNQVYTTQRQKLYLLFTLSHYISAWHMVGA